jgi:hypothetical protein
MLVPRAHKEHPMKSLSSRRMIGCLLASCGVLPAFAQSTPPTVYLQPQVPANSASFQNWIAGVRYGEVNFLERYTSGGQFSKFFRPLLPDDPPTIANGCTGSAVKIPLPIGDRLGYDTAALFDVNGDKFNDWAETWYHAEPVSALHEASDPLANRATDDAVILPGGPANSDTPAELRAQAIERVGFCRVVSGVQPLLPNGNLPGTGGSWTGTNFLSPSIWGNANNVRLAHEIASIMDIDGDDRGELILGTNGTEGESGSINVFSYTNLYNVNRWHPDPLQRDETPRWVCIWRIIGDTPGASELAYELEDNLVDVNNDGRVDILAASVWWREDTGGRNPSSCFTTQRGGGWVFLTPPETLFQAIQYSNTWPALDGDPLVKRPLVMAEADASLKVHNPVITSGCGPQPVADLASAGDMDADGKLDLVVNAGFVDGAVQRRGLYFFLSYDGYNDFSGATLCGSVERYTQLNAGGNAPEPNPAFTQLTLEPSQADFVIRGDSGYDFKYNTGSLTGMDFDNASPTVPGQPEVVLMWLAAAQGHNSGTVHMLMNMPGRFGAGVNGGPTGSRYAEVFGAGQPYGHPKRYQFGGPDSLFQPSTDYEFISRFNPNGVPDPPSATHNSLSDTASIIAINIAGNFDGAGFLDCELAVNLVRNAWQTPPAYNRGDAVVLAFPPPSGGASPPAPTQLMRIIGENNKKTVTSDFMLNNEEMDFLPCPIASPERGYWPKIINEDISVNQHGCMPEPGWDQDGDGRDDLIIRAPFFPKQVNTVPTCAPASPNCGGTADVPPAAANDSPYYVDGGADYLILSTPAQPVLQWVSPWSHHDTNNDGTLDVSRCTVLVKAPVPWRHPYNMFRQEDIRLTNGGCSGTCPPVSHPTISCNPTGDTLRQKDTPATGVDTVIVEFPYASVSVLKSPCIKFNTRWRGGSFPGQDFAFCVCPPVPNVTVIEE